MVIINCSPLSGYLGQVQGLNFDNICVFLFVPTCVLSAKDKMYLPGNSKASVCDGVRFCSVAQAHIISG